MATEIERKFLVDLQALGELGEGTFIKQAYIATADKTAVRLRLKGEQAFLTLKGANNGISRSEFEYPIPVADAQAIMAELCSGPAIEKTRYLIEHSGHTWELDIFYGDNEGLIVAEIELSSESEHFEKPNWVKEEVSGDPKYYNSSLLNNPYKQW
ncbi:CYTH domain-containing protein [Leucothrix sargassi]|nr:CYTH domain-containing protein [Leucothrix sargassi]